MGVGVGVQPGDLGREVVDLAKCREEMQVEPPGHPISECPTINCLPVPLGIVASVDPLSLRVGKGAWHACHSPGLFLN